MALLFAKTDSLRFYFLSGVMTYTFNASNWEAGAGRSLGFEDSLVYIEKPCLNFIYIVFNGGDLHTSIVSAETVKHWTLAGVKNQLLPSWCGL